MSVIAFPYLKLYFSVWNAYARLPAKIPCKRPVPKRISNPTAIVPPLYLEIILNLLKRKDHY